MTNASKIVSRKKAPGVKVPRIGRVKFDMETAKDAIVDGKLTVGFGSKVCTPRNRNGKISLSVCEIKSIEPDGTLYFWDETLSQWYLFKVTDPVVVKIMTAVPIPDLTQEAKEEK